MYSWKDLGLPYFSLLYMSLSKVISASRLILVHQFWVNQLRPRAWVLQCFLNLSHNIYLPYRIFLQFSLNYYFFPCVSLKLRYILIRSISVCYKTEYIVYNIRVYHSLQFLCFSLVFRKMVSVYRNLFFWIFVSFCNGAFSH